MRELKPEDIQLVSGGAPTSTISPYVKLLFLPFTAAFAVLFTSAMGGSITYAEGWDLALKSLLSEIEKG